MALAEEETKMATTGEEGAQARPGEAEPPKYLVRMEDPDVRWYVVHTLTGHEQKVKSAIDRGVAERNLGDYIFCVLVPAEEVTTQTKAGKNVRRKVFFPGYVLVQMKVSEESWGFVRRTGGVTGFVGSGSSPTPLSDEEVRSSSTRSRAASRSSRSRSTSRRATSSTSPPAPSPISRAWWRRFTPTAASARSW